MAKESQVPTPSKSNIRRIGDLLFEEALEYEELNPTEAGNYLRYLVHDDGRWISIHFRGNLDQLRKIESRLERSKAFLRAIEKDLHLLAEALKEDLQLRDVRMIIGLSSLSASWGRKHGFTTLLYTTDEELISRHNDSITNNPNKGKGRLTPLTLFFFAPRGFIAKFHRGDLSCV